MFLKALPAMQDVHCTIVGTGPDEKELRSMAEGHPVRFLGYRSDMVKIYPGFDVLVVPSRSESFCITAIEAQAMGIPIIAHDIPVMREIGGDSYIFYQTAEDLVRIINKRSWDSERIKQKGTKNARKYSVQKYAALLHGFYASIFRA
jgi:glycosyltransferase involved in cell wall biosynthesis